MHAVVGFIRSGVLVAITILLLVVVVVTVSAAYYLFLVRSRRAAEVLPQSLTNGRFDHV